MNLTVLLTNGRCTGQGEFDLGQPVDAETASKLGHQGRGRGQAQQTSSKEGAHCLHLGFFRQHQGNGPSDGQDSSSPRGQPSCPATGIRVCALDPTGGGQLVANPDGLQLGMAEGQQEHESPALHGPVHDRDPEGAPGQAPEGTGQRGYGSGLHQVPPHRCESNDAFPSLGCRGTAVVADQGQTASDWRGESHHSDNPSDPPVGTGNHPSLPLPLQGSDGRGIRQGSSVSLDSGQSHAGRTLESLANRVISQHLATCEIDIAATDPTKNSTCEAAGKDDVDDHTKFMVRILENDTSTMCFVNAALIALAWCTLLCQGLNPSCWAFGFELLRGLCQWNPLPLNLRVFQPFLWLLFGAFQIEDLAVQQDILEFTAFIIDRLSPTFLSCRWCTKFQHITRVSHPVLDSEKGDRYAPILLRFINYLDDTCNLTDLIAYWHDFSGLCRASNQERRCLILMFDRHIESHNCKCSQKVQLMSDIVHFPCFADAEGNVIFLPFHIAAVAYHIGNTPNTGHHRTALKYHGQWLAYDDNRLPDHLSELSDDILRNLTMIWLVQPTDTAVRTMERQPGQATSASRPAAASPSAASASSMAELATTRGESGRGRWTNGH